MSLMRKDALKDLIIARENEELDSLISYAYPYLLDREKISDSIEKIKDYAEDSLPVLSKNKKIIGIITAQDVVEAVDDEDVEVLDASSDVSDSLLEYKSSSSASVSSSYSVSYASSELSFEQPALSKPTHMTTVNNIINFFFMSAHSLFPLSFVNLSHISINIIPYTIYIFL